MKQRLGIARAVIHSPKVLLLDEPASGLDPKARLDLRKLLSSLRDQGITILISSHILSELEGFCTSIGIMEKGRLLKSGRIDEVTATEKPGRAIRIRWIGDSARNVESVLEKKSQVLGAQLQDGEGTFQLMGTDEDMAELLAELLGAGIRVVSFSETKHTVEDIYMKVSHHQVM